MERLDEKACRALRERLPCPGAIFLSGDCPADIMTGILHRFSCLVTSRYHAAVLSMERGCPIVAVSMDERLDGIMRELSLDRKYLLRVTDEALGEKLYSALEDARSNQTAIHRRIQSQLLEYRDRLADMGAFLKQYIQDGLRAAKDGNHRDRYHFDDRSHRLSGNRACRPADPDLSEQNLCAGSGRR